MKVLIIDDQVHFREKLRRWCLAEPKFEVVTLVDNCYELIHKANHHAPDLIFFDEKLLDDVGLAMAIDNLCEANPHLKIIFLSESPSLENLARATQRRGSGYLMKENELVNLLPVIRDLKPGDFVLSPKLAQTALTGLRDFLSAVVLQEINKLTSREKEVLTHICAGLGNREIAQSLVISENTVRIHVQNILKKLNLKHRRQVQERYGLVTNGSHPLVPSSKPGYQEPEDRLDG